MLDGSCSSSARKFGTIQKRRKLGFVQRMTLVRRSRWWDLIEREAKGELIYFVPVRTEGQARSKYFRPTVGIMGFIRRSILRCAKHAPVPTSGNTGAVVCQAKPIAK